ncbi:cytochrome c oxidase assembly protein [Roseiterribacter gracilis]|uniref:Cytochrome c oxidase assembly protein CtaG n=1 Tax=Roseiterribacter gracilis TaxID=2812848 RepID=A0A8S8XEK6_9PROT|nr:cytochrome c oxidase assembly protein CtaG [Rhodospirillales bacterium TMPK1]
MNKNGKTIGLLSVVVVAMVGLSFAAVPLYRMFCEATGFNGTTQRADAGATHTVNRIVEVRFNSNVSPELPWKFGPEERSVKVKLGETRLTSFFAQNLSGEDITGVARYNVTPEKVGKYFVKTQCFCFDDQRLEARQRVDMPVYFFVDPDFASDPDMADVNVITLSYTFFRARTSQAASDGFRARAPQTAQIAAPAAPVASSASR